VQDTKNTSLLSSIQRLLASLPTTLPGTPSLKFPEMIEAMTEATTEARMTTKEEISKARTTTKEETSKVKMATKEETSKVRMATRERISKVKMAEKQGNSSRIKTAQSISARIIKVTILRQGLSLSKLNMGTIEVDKMVHKEITTAAQAEVQAVVIHLDLRLQVRMARSYRCLDGDICKWKASLFMPLPIIS
jgi:hypothetical protein